MTLNIDIEYIRLYNDGNTFERKTVCKTRRRKLQPRRGVLFCGRFFKSGEAYD